MQASTLLAVRIFAVVALVFVAVAGSVVWLMQRADSNKKRGVENRELIVRDRQALRATQEKQSRILMCLSEAKDPQSCLSRVVGATGPGGATGRQGVRGERGLGVIGRRGPRGVPGVGRRGPRGRPGSAGRDGKDGAPAPVVPEAPVIVPEPLPTPEVAPPPPLVPCALQPAELGYLCAPAPVAVPPPVP
jgi:hypothetical protein